MKRIFAILLLCSFASNHPFPKSGALVGESVQPILTEKYRILFVSDKLLYNNGGVVFNYPITMEGNPVLNVSVELLTTFDPATTYVPIILVNSPTGCTIIVNKIIYDSGTHITTVTEASTNEVAVHIWVVDQ